MQTHGCLSSENIISSSTAKNCESAETFSSVADRTNLRFCQRGRRVPIRPNPEFFIRYPDNRGNAKLLIYMNPIHLIDKRKEVIHTNKVNSSSDAD